MGIFILILLIEIACSFFIARAMYKSPEKNNYKNPGVAAVIVFIFILAIFLGVSYLLLSVMFQR